TRCPSMSLYYLLLCSYSFFVYPLSVSHLFFFNDPAPSEIYTLSLHDALPILHLLNDVPHIHLVQPEGAFYAFFAYDTGQEGVERSEEHTSELQSRFDLVCRLLLEKKKKLKQNTIRPKRQLQQQ